MSDPQTNPLLGLPSTVWIALILGLAGIFALTQKPFQDTRPQNIGQPLSFQALGDCQNIEARLWEDPLSAVATAFQGKELPATAETLRTDGSTLVLAVMVSGAPYVEDVETRRRERYAVLAGLYRSGFIPSNHDHIGYIVTKAEPSKADTALSAHPATTAAAAASPCRPPPSNVAQSLGAHHIAAFEWLLPDETGAQRAGIADSSPTENSAVGSNARILLLWVDQDGLRADPIADLSSLLDQFVKDPRVLVSVLGPADSDGLRAMYDEATRNRKEDVRLHENQAVRVNRPLRPMWFYSSRATASDALVLNVQDAARGSVANVLKQYAPGLQLYRVVADDQQVANALMRELSRRGIDRPGEIVLVAKRDTLYARRMGSYFPGGCSDPPATDPSVPQARPDGKHVLCYTYLKGLDGLAPSVAADKNSAAKNSQAKTGTSTSDDGTTATASDAAIGPGQLDYLRRLADSIAAQHRTSRHIRAIGVISSDVYDKLLVLQALHSALPSVTYFTFDFDARLLDQRNLTTTRQLIVGSTLGPALRPELQGDIPPFRDTYQTSTFYATMLAIHHFLSAPGPRGLPETSPGTAVDVNAPITAAAPTGSAASPPCDPVHQEPGLEWTCAPRVLEIGRRQAFDLYGANTNEPCTFERCPRSAAVREATLWRDPAPRLARLLVGLAAAAACLGAWAIAFGTRTLFGRPRTYRVPIVGERRWDNAVVSLIAAALVVAATYLLWPGIVAIITRYDSVPTPVFGGANQWTGTLVDALVILAVVVLVVRGQRKLHDNAESLRREFHLPKTPERLITWHKTRLRAAHRHELLRNLLWFPIRPLPQRSGIELATGRVSGIEAIIAQYLHRGTAGARLLRVTVGTVVSFLLLMFLEAIPGTFVISQFSVFEDHTAHQWFVDLISMVSLFAMQFLILWVADALLLSRSFLLALLRDNPAWPADVLNSESARMGMPRERTALWLDLQLIARRTSCVANLVWYPSFVIAAMCIAMLTIQFGEFQFANNPIALVIGTTFVIGSALALRGATETWRRHVQRKLQDDRLREHGAPDYRSADQLDQLLQRVNDLREGAFAPYSQQPVVRAVLVPAVTYGATLVLQYTHLT